MKVNYVSAYVKKKVRFKKGQDTVVNYGRKIEVNQLINRLDIIDIVDILISYVHTEVSGGLVVEGFNRGLDDFNLDLEIARDTFSECSNKLHAKGIVLNTDDIKENLFSE